MTRYWPVALGAIVAILLALAWVLWRRRSVDRLDAVEGVAAERLPRSDVARGRLDMTFRPIRAGLNLLSATSENEIVVTNIGDALADSIHLHVALVSAHAGQDAEIAALSASPAGRPVVPAFALHPGEQRTLSAVAALPREALRTLTAGGRPMFVPIVAVTLTYVTAGVERRLAQAFAVGVERVDSSKLAPFWLDVPPRSFDQVAARPHAAAVES